MLAQNALREVTEHFFRITWPSLCILSFLKIFRSLLAFDLLLFWGLSTAFSFLAHSQTHLGSSMNPAILGFQVFLRQNSRCFLTVMISSSFRYPKLFSPAQRNNHSLNTAHTQMTRLHFVCCVTLNLTGLKPIFPIYNDNWNRPSTASREPNYIIWWYLRISKTPYHPVYP